MGSNMNRQLLTIAVVLFTCASARAELIITSIFDGAGGTPRGIELFVAATGSFEDWTVDLEFNNNTDPLADEFGVGHVFDSTIYNEGDFIYVTGTPADSILTATSSAIIDAPTLNIINGDDRVRISNVAGDVIDQYGVSGQDGTGEAWEYTGSFAYRNDNTSPTGAFEIGEWTIAPVNSLIANGNGALQDRLGSFVAVPEPSTLILFGLAGLGLGLKRRRA